MAEFKTLNGYDVKDEIARNQITQLNSDFTEKINEVNNKINELNTKNYISLKRIGRILKDNYKYTAQAPSFAPYQLQGNCYCKNNIAVGVFLDQERSKDTKGRLTKINLLNMSEMLTVDIANVGHANWVSYNKDLNEVYITKGNNFDIIVVDFDTFNIKKTINVSTVITDNNPLSSFSYDNITKKYYVNTYQHIYNIDINTLEVLSTVTLNWGDYFLESGLYDYKTQGANIHNNLIYYTVMQPQSLAVFNLEGEILQTYQINNLTYPYYLTREIEEISINLDNDNELIFGTTGETTLNSEENISQFFKGNLKYNYLANLPNFRPLINRTFHVDSTSNVPNPDGTSDYPFKCIGEALDLLFNEMYTAITISLADGNYSYFTLVNPKVKFVTIEGNENNPENTTINKFQIINGHIALHNLTIDNKYNRFNYSSTLYKSSGTLITVDYKETKELLLNIQFGSELIYRNLTRNGSVNLTQNMYDIQAQSSKIFALDNALLTKFVGYNFINKQKITPDLKAVSGVVSGISSLVPEILQNGSVTKISFEYGFRNVGISSLQSVEPSIANDSFRIDYSGYAGTDTALINSMYVNVTENIEISNNKAIKITGGSVSVEDVTDASDGLYLIAIYIE